MVVAAENIMKVVVVSDGVVRRQEKRMKRMYVWSSKDY